MTASNTFETNTLKLVFNASAFATIADNAAASPAAALYVSLHTADPGEAGGQSSSEANYTGYVRVAVARSTAGWTVSGNVASNAASITFGTSTGGANSLTHFGIGLAASGAGTLLFSGALDAALPVATGVTPVFAAGQLTVTAD